MIRLPQRVWSQFATILGLAGTKGLEGVQSEVVPVQDLSRIMQADRCHRTTYQFINTPAASAASTLDYNIASEWTEIRVDGVLVTANQGLPPVNDDRILVMAGLLIGDTPAEYTSAELLRFVPFTVPNRVQIAQWGAIVTSHNSPTLTSPMMFPQYLVPGESDIRFEQIVTGANARFELVVQMVSAEPGVMAFYAGV